MTSPSGDDNSGDPHTSDELASADPFRRVEATLRLGSDATPQALDQLLALLADPEWPVVEAALKALRRYRDPRIVAAALAILREDYYSWIYSRGIAIARVATRALRSQGEEGFQALITLLSEFKDDEVRGQAVERQLAVLRDPRAIGPLIACFNSPVYEVANRAAAKMRHFGPAAIPPLIAAMSTTDESVYYHVAWALRWIGAPAVAALLDALRHSPDENIRAGAANVLDRVDSEEIREALYAALDDGDDDVRDAAMWSLGRLGDPRVLDQLLVEQPSRGPGSLQPASTLAEIGSPVVLPLIAALEDRVRPAYQRVNAARALGKIEDERTVEPLIVALRDDDEEVRLAAVSALGDLKYVTSVESSLAALTVEPLLAASHDPSPEVRRGAISELAAIDDERTFDAVVRYVRESGEGEEGYKSTSGLLHTLALHHGERALPLLREMALGSDRWRWLMAIHGLSQLGAPGVSALLEIGQDPQPQRLHLVITWLKHAYHRSPDPRIVEFLFAITQERGNTAPGAAFMRFEAARALADCGDSRAVAPLVEILQNPAIPLTIRDSAVGPLGELGDERVLAALVATYEASMAEEDGSDADERPRWRYMFQDALLRAMAKIRARLGMT